MWGTWDLLYFLLQVNLQVNLQVSHKAKWGYSRAPAPLSVGPAQHRAMLQPQAIFIPGGGWLGLCPTFTCRLQQWDRVGGSSHTDPCC